MDQQTTYQGPEGGAEMPALGAGIVPPPPNQQLPAQMFTTAAQLLDLTDSKISRSATLCWKYWLCYGYLHGVY